MDAGLDAQFGTAGLQQTAAQNSASTRKSARPGELFFMISHMLAPLRYSVLSRSAMTDRAGSSAAARISRRVSSGSLRTFGRRFGLEHPRELGGSASSKPPTPSD
jgi:hypothetical protein